MIKSVAEGAGELQFAFPSVLAVQAAQVSQRLCCSVTAHQRCSAFVFFSLRFSPTPQSGPFVFLQGQWCISSCLFLSCLTQPSPNSLVTSARRAQKHLQCLSAGQNSWWFVRIRKILVSQWLRTPMEVHRTFPRLSKDGVPKRREVQGDASTSQPLLCSGQLLMLLQSQTGSFQWVTAEEKQPLR